ncbi:MAG TPA: ATP-binding protein, partial [Polyangiaceae bacterium]|nr:ATP-binding protein [Polyangiaceae bacterium]
FCLASDLAADRDGILTDRAKRVALLVLDDLGKEEDPKRRIFAVLDHRHTRRPTVITSGLKLDDLDRHYSDGAMSRRIVEFRGQMVSFVSAFKSDQPLRVVGPGDQDAVAARLGEKP